MDFTEAETRYRELRSRMVRGESLSRVEFEEQVSQLAVQDEHSTWWQIHPHTASWMYYDGMQWVQGIPPGHDRSQVVPISSPGTTIPPSASASLSAQANNVSEPPPGHPDNAATGVQMQPRVLRRLRGRERDRAWIPFAVASVLLLACAALVFFGGPRVLGALAQQPTSTRTAIARRNTPTLTPTVMLQPTLSSPTETPTPVLAKVIEQRVNVRAAPSLNANIVDKIQQDDLITLIGRSEDGKWYHVMIAGKAEPAWVFGETLQITNGDPVTLPIVK